MTRVAVTGDSGRLGWPVITDLVQQGYGCSTSMPLAPRRQAPFIRMEMTDYWQVFDALSGVTSCTTGSTWSFS